jgi:hypothetical protein
MSDEPRTQPAKPTVPEVLPLVNAIYRRAREPVRKPRVYRASGHPSADERYSSHKAFEDACLTNSAPNLRSA